MDPSVPDLPQKCDSRSGHPVCTAGSYTGRAFASRMAGRYSGHDHPISERVIMRATGR
jgi:hypothetical protein